MIGNKRNFSLTIWDHKDNFLDTLKSANSEFEGQSFNENFNESITGEKTLTFSVPMYIFNYKEFVNDEEKIPNRYDKNNFIQNKVWQHIYNEQKIRYIEYNNDTNKPERIEEFVLKNYTESRNGEEKIADCTCESLAVYELGKVGWGITWDTDYISLYDSQEVEDCLTIDYWMRKLLYKETNLGRVSNTTECTYLLQGIQLRNNEGFPISGISYTTSIDGKNEYQIIEEPICSLTTSDEFIKYYNPTGWSWEIQATFENDPDKQNISILYESPTINKFIEVQPNYFIPQSYQKGINSNSTAPIQLREHPIKNEDLDKWTYVTDIKRHLMEVEHSNIFSIIQELCEAFQVWAHFTYEYDLDGSIKERKIIFKTESYDDEIKFDFSYGKNLESCSRILDSSDLITKLYVTNTDSTLVDGNILSIQQASANPTGENYIYNFNYFYQTKMLSSIEQFENENKDITESDEYKINLHCGKLRNINNKISNIQKYLSPLYDLQMELQSDLIIQEGAKTGYIDNIQNIEDKIAAIPFNERLIKSWSEDNNQYNHVGETKTFSITTSQGIQYKYVDFGREDVLIGNINTFYKYDPNLNEQLTDIPIEGFIPRIFNYNSNWHSGSPAIADNNTNNFILLQNGNSDLSQIQYNISELGNGDFIKGIYFNFANDNINSNYGRIRYKYAPLAYYYLLIQDYQNKLKEVNDKINKLEENLIKIENKIFIYELEIKNLLKDKNELILQFEKQYKPYIREGYWEPSDYKSESINKTFYTETDPSEKDNFDGFDNENKEFRTLKLNNSLNCFTKYFSLGSASNIDVDSVTEMLTYIPAHSGDTFLTVPITRLRGLNFELYLNENNELLVGISPELIDNYNTYKYSEDCYKGILTYKTIDGNITTTTKVWEEIPEFTMVKNNYIYLSDDNIIPSTLQIYGGNNTDIENLLEQYVDWTYQYESAAYDSQGNRYDISNSYSTNLFYDYSLKINLKLTNNIIKYLDSGFTVNYDEETTLQYLYNDATQMSEKYAMPKTEYSISVVDLSSLNGYEYYKPKVGQLVPIWDIEMGLKNFQGFITSVSFPLEEKYNTQIEIATYNTKFEDIFQKLTATVTNIQYNEGELYKAAEAFEATTGAIKTDVFQKSLQDNFNRISLGTNNEITIDKQSGITLKDIDNKNGVKLIGSGIFLTEDITKPSEDIEWKTGITGNGINANAITAGNIDTKQINIWNASERQVRFIWNEQGLFAYGDKFSTEENPTMTTSISTEQDLIDYNKYVKFNQEGLNFTDNNKSALKLGWTGLKIQTQEDSLNLDADKGLVLQQWNSEHSSSTTRLELGKLDNGNLYGLRLKDTDGEVTLQSDTRGDLWLHQNLQLGGRIEDNVVYEATAGIYGLSTSTNVPIKMQMGLRRDNNGVLIWDDTPIRFWAGPQDQVSYTTNIHVNNEELKKVSGSTNFINLNIGDPSLAKFKVSANGDIIASGIDVGGWIGQGDKLRSFDNEAIMRSNSYSTSAPVFAIGKPNNANIEFGSNYNFRVYQDGTLNIGNDQFIAYPNGRVIAQNITINSSSSSINGGNIAGWIITNEGIEKITYNSNTNTTTKTGIYAKSGSDSNVIQIGNNNNPEFKVDGLGAVTASKITITGGNGTWIINSNNFQVDSQGQIGAGAKLNSFNGKNYDFSVDRDGNIRFKGTISAYHSNGTWYKGVDYENVATVSINNQNITLRIVKGLIVGVAMS